jgi:glycosyltransferase involved in cell wall biosynthesis
MPEQLSQKPVLSLIIPLYNEDAHLQEVIRVIKNVVDALQLTYEFILVNDGSTDKTWEIIQDLSRQNPSIRAAKLSRNFGKEAALCAGLELASGEAAILMDGDLQHPPELIPDMIRIWKDTQADVVEAIKIVRGEESPLKKIGANLFYFLLRQLSGFDFTGASDYKLLDRKVVDAWKQLKERNLFFRGMVTWLGFKHVQISFTVPERAGGKSKWSTLRLFRLAITAVAAFSSKPLFLIALVGAIFILAAVIITIIEIYQKAIGFAVSGFATVIILELIIGSMMMFALTLIGIYIANIYEEVKGRPRYIISQIINKIEGNSNES